MYCGGVTTGCWRTRIGAAEKLSVDTMPNEEPSKSWWQTLPGIVTSLTAAITAIAGLVVAIKQTGWFEPASAPVASQPSTQLTSGPGKPMPMPAPVEAPPSGTSQSSASGAIHGVRLPAMRDYKLGPASTQATFTLLSAEVSPQTSGMDALRVQVRMTNHDRFDHNFWDRSFRLIINGVPTAPKSDLNELVPPEAAKEGTVIFVFPRGTTGGNLEITYVDDRTSIPLVFAAPK
jgi:hypothetical protein